MPTPNNYIQPAMPSEEDARRVRAYPITPNLLMALFQGQQCFIPQNPIPKDSRLVSASWDFETQNFLLFITSREFDLIPNCELPPRYEVTVTTGPCLTKPTLSAIQDLHFDCCYTHGCIYSEPTCPIASGVKRQAIRCKVCEEVRDPLTRAIDVLLAIGVQAQSLSPSVQVESLKLGADWLEAITSSDRLEIVPNSSKVELVTR